MFASVTALVIAVPTRLVPNGFFSRMTPTRPLDYVLLVVSSALLGLTLALRATGTGAARSRPALRSGGAAATEIRAVTAGVGTVLAVGCPVCNKVVVALLGTGGAITVFGPLQPVIGLAAAGLLVAGVSRQLHGLGTAVCQRPVSG